MEKRWVRNRSLALCICKSYPVYRTLIAILTREVLIPCCVHWRYNLYSKVVEVAKVTKFGRQCIEKGCYVNDIELGICDNTAAGLILLVHHA